MQVAVSGNFAKERAPGKDEKPEDKEKLDKEFKDKLAKHEEKLKNEKRFEQWVYIVPKYTVEPLLKGRQELLKEEPKAEEKKEETTSSSSTESKRAPATPADSLVPKIAPATSTK
jgi:putative NADH-flavin reductase